MLHVDSNDTVGARSVFVWFDQLKVRIFMSTLLSKLGRFPFIKMELKSAMLSCSSEFCCLDNFLFAFVEQQERESTPSVVVLWACKLARNHWKHDLTHWRILQYCSLQATIFVSFPVQVSSCVTKQTGFWPQRPRYLLLHSPCTTQRRGGMLVGGWHISGRVTVSNLIKGAVTISIVHREGVMFSILHRGSCSPNGRGRTSHPQCLCFLLVLYLCCWGSRKTGTTLAVNDTSNFVHRQGVCVMIKFWRCFVCSDRWREPDSGCSGQ